ESRQTGPVKADPCVLGAEPVLVLVLRPGSHDRGSRTTPGTKAVIPGSIRAGRGIYPEPLTSEPHFGPAPVVGDRLDGPRRQHLNLELPRGGRLVGHAGGRRRRDRQLLRAVVPRQLRPRALVLQVPLAVAVILIQRELAVGAV